MGETNEEEKEFFFRKRKKQKPYFSPTSISIIESIKIRRSKRSREKSFFPERKKNKEEEVDEKKRVSFIEGENQNII